MSILDFEIILEQSENVEFAGKSIKNDFKTRIEPFQKVEVAKFILKNNWKLKSKFKLSFIIPDRDKQNEYIEEEKNLLKNEIKKHKKILSTIQTDILSRDEIESILEDHKIKFIDLDFPPCDNSIVNPKYGDNIKDIFEYVIHWRRPEEFIPNEKKNTEKSEIKIFNEYEPDPNDILQGMLPDINLVSAFSALAEKYNMIIKLFNSEKISKHGFYQVKLCICGEWVNVCVDDLFPCIPKSNPLVSKSHGDEIWVLILEKAMAKIFECYYNLIPIFVSEYLMILTGFPTVSLDIKEMLNFEGEENLFKKIKQLVVDKKYLTVAVSKSEVDSMNEVEFDTDNSLIIPNFGYTVLDVKYKTKDYMIVLRKVWNDQKKDEIIKKYQENLFKLNPSLKSDINEGTLMICI